MNSLLLGEGHVFHSRPGKSANKFSYPTFFLHFCVDAEAELDQLFRARFARVLSLKSQDYLEGHERPLAESIRQFLQEKLQYSAEEVWLQTLPRMFGYVFNPVSFWILKKNGILDAVLCEVNNTFGERHFYFVRALSGELSNTWQKSDKVFHVSPFLPIEGSYEFRFQFKPSHSSVDIVHLGPDEQVRLITWVKGSLLPLAEKSLTKLLLRYGWMTLLVMLRIHYQAFKLFFKKARFYSKPPLPPKDVSQ